MTLPIGRWAAVLCALTATDVLPRPSLADEGAESFWIPGFYASLAAVPQTPGWTLATVYYHAAVKAGADVSFSRQAASGNITEKFTGNLAASLAGDADLGFAIPTYVFATPLLGGQASVGLAVPFGHESAFVDATLTGAPGAPGYTVSGSRADSVTGFGDIAPQGSLRWNAGVHNWMAYFSGSIPVGAYNPKRLANLSLAHVALDSGGGYTYFDATTGREFSAVLGFTYNFENPHTHYQSGVDMHLDLGASQFLTKQLQIGAAGYAYKQLTCDSGAGNRLGCFEARVFGLGPQIGYSFPLGTQKGYLNLRGYREFGAERRPEGWNLWLTFVISPAPPHGAPPRPISAN